MRDDWRQSLKKAVCQRLANAWHPVNRSSRWRINKQRYQGSMVTNLEDEPLGAKPLKFCLILIKQGLLDPISVSGNHLSVGKRCG